MKPISTSIIHIGLFILVGLILILTFAKNAVSGVSGYKKLAQLFTYKHRDNLSCQFTKVPDLTLDTSPNFPRLECDDKTCLIRVNKDGEEYSFSPVNNAGIDQIDIENFFYDDNRKLIFYTTSSPDLSSRIVMNYSGELIQSIDETPGKNRQLIFQGYQPETGMLVYFDQKSNDTYFYSANSIYFARRRCL